MPHFKCKRRLSYKAEQIFDIIADVERYADFLPGWRSTRIVKREGNISYVDQEVGLGVFRTRFCTQALFIRPTRIDITSTDNPFQQLTIHWLFEPVTDLSCLLQFYVDFELSSTYLNKIVAPLFSSHLQRIISAFEERANFVYSESAELPEFRGNQTFSNTDSFKIK